MIGPVAGPFLVRKPAASIDTTPKTGDGPGAENAVPIGGANRVVLFINIGAVSTTLRIEAEVSVDGETYYRTTDQSAPASGVVTVKKLNYDLAGADISGPAALLVPVFGGAARFTAYLTSGSFSNPGGITAMTEHL